MIKVLCIGQLPKVAGGSYTSGIANVVYELSKQRIDGVEMFVFSTNTDSRAAQNNSNNICHYLGYKKNFAAVIWGMIKNPKETYYAWQLYKKTNDVSPLHIEFIKYNCKRVINEIKPDLIHVHNSMDALYYANKNTKIPVLYTLHGLMWSGEDVDDLQEKRWKLMAQQMLPLAKHYTTLNDRALRKMQKLGVDKNQVTIIPNGVDTRKFYYSILFREKIRMQMNVPDNFIVFITVGTVIDRKGQFMFLKLIEKMGVNYQYWIIGNGPDCVTIKKYTHDNCIETKVKMVGYVDDINIFKYLSAADIYVHGSTVEGQSLAEIEAYATGLRTVINSQVADTVIGDISDSYHYHILDFDTPNLLSLDEWLHLPEKERCTQSKYDWSAIASMYGNLYRTIVEEEASNKSSIV